MFPVNFKLRIVASPTTPPHICLYYIIILFLNIIIFFVRQLVCVYGARSSLHYYHVDFEYYSFSSATSRILLLLPFFE